MRNATNIENPAQFELIAIFAQYLHERPTSRHKKVNENKERIAIEAVWAISSGGKLVDIISTLKNLLLQNQKLTGSELGAALKKAIQTLQFIEVKHKKNFMQTAQRYQNETVLERSVNELKSIMEGVDGLGEYIDIDRLTNVTATLTALKKKQAPAFQYRELLHRADNQVFLLKQLKLLGKYLDGINWFTEHTQIKRDYLAAIWFVAVEDTSQADKVSVLNELIIKINLDSALQNEYRDKRGHNFFGMIGLTLQLFQQSHIHFTGPSLEQLPTTRAIEIPGSSRSINAQKATPTNTMYLPSFTYSTPQTHSTERLSLLVNGDTSHEVELREIGPGFYNRVKK